MQLQLAAFYLMFVVCFSSLFGFHIKILKLPYSIVLSNVEYNTAPVQYRYKLCESKRISVHVAYLTTNSCTHIISQA